jgi:pimeloyl-ACP methyl ester carboxylesterase
MKLRLARVQRRAQVSGSSVAPLHPTMGWRAVVVAQKPFFTGRHTVFHGFGRSAHETAPGLEPFTWWGSDNYRLPEGARETNVRLQAEDGAHSSGVLYRRGGEKTVVVFNHPRADFASHYLAPVLVAGGYAAFGGQTRYLGNDVNCEHECICADVAAQIRYLRAEGFERVVLCGNSGGGPLSTFYMEQANTQPPHRLATTAAGEPYDLNALDLPPADGMILLAGALSEGALELANLDPSVTDESDPLSCDPALDMFNPANGYRKPPEVSRYSPEFLARYREAQRARCQRIDARARQDVERRRKHRAMMQAPGFAALPLEEQNHITRMAAATNVLTIYRTMADPALTDLSIHPSKRQIVGLMQPDPQTANWGFPGFVAVMTPEGWLSTWSGLSTRCDMHANVRNLTQPLLVINFEADVTILPFVAEGAYANASSPDKELARIDADHFAFKAEGPRDAGIQETGDFIVRWLKPRFPAAE